MSLNPDQANQVWGLFKSSPLWVKWPQYEKEVAQRLSPMQYPAGRIIYRPDEPADRLYLIGEGTVRQTIEHDGQVWFQRDLGPGDYFGQQALFTERHKTLVTAITPVTVYTMSAAELRRALEKNADLHESLVRETRAARLRAVPLFEPLSDDEIRWLAVLTEDVTEGADVSLPLDTKKGVWVIDWGQVAVAGAASRNRQGWRLTYGNFFVSPGMRTPPANVAPGATTAVPSRLFFLAEEHVYRLMQVFGGVGRALRGSIDIVKALDGVPEFTNGMTEEHLQHLAEFTGWAFVPDGQNITTQGTIGTSFIIVQRGAALIRAIDEQGRLRPRNLIRVGEYFGATSLLTARARDATVRAVGSGGLDGVEILTLDRRDLQYAFDERPDLWHEGVPLFDRFTRVREENVTFDWQEEGESVIWWDHPHWLWLVAPLVLVVLVFLGLVLSLLFAEVGQGWRSSLEPVILLLSFLFFVPLVAVIVFNYRDDYYVVTNRRVTRRDRILLIRESRTDAPIEMVQDVTVDANFIGRAFDYGNVTIRTAAKVGSVKFEKVPQPDIVRTEVLRGKAEAAAASKGQTRESLRRGLMDGLRLTLSVPDLDQSRALGDRAPALQKQVPRWRRWLDPTRSAKPVILPGTRRPKPSWLQRIVKPLPERAQKVILGPPPPEVKPVPSQYVWRKHWLNFFQRAGLPLLATVVVFLIGLIVLLSPGAAFGLNSAGLLLGWLVLLAVFGIWLAWEAADYWNDIYVVTDERLIDIEARPLGLSIQRRETTLDRVQSVFAEQKGFWAAVLDFGNVIIQTAAADAGFTFTMVRSPKRVQKLIFQKLDAYRRKQDERAVTERQRALIEGLEVYHELREERGGRRI